jgi:hypothetical protein
MTRQTVTNPDGTQDFLFAVREVHTGDDGSLSWSAEPSFPIGETWHELADSLMLYGGVISTAVLDIDTREWLKPGRSANKRP